MRQVIPNSDGDAIEEVVSGNWKKGECPPDWPTNAWVRTEPWVRTEEFT